MSTAHTPEPWTWNKWNKDELTICGELFIACIPHLKVGLNKTHEANAQRIVECVNAMQGI